MVQKEVKKLKNNEMRKDLSPFFNPRIVAIIGSFSQQTWFGGQVLLENLWNWEYSGKIYLINPSYDEVRGLKVYPTVKDLTETADLAIIIAAARQVPSIVKDCAEKGVKAIIIVSDGFAERGEEGAELQNEVVEIARGAGIRILGPNTLGTVNTTNGLVTIPYITRSRIKRGNIALAAQTGLISPTASRYGDLGYKISKICDFGNKCDLDEIDLLEYLAGDLETKVIAMEIEGIRDGRRFLDVAKRVAKKKPILIFKPGRTKESKKALMSHTGSIAGDKKIYESAFKQAGIIQANSLRELLEIAKAFSYQPLPEGNRLGIITITGAGGAMATDIAIESGLVLAKLSAETDKKLYEIHPTLVGNPSDIGQMAGMGMPPYREVIEAMLNDENVDCLLCTLQGMISVDYYAQVLNEIKKSKSKPITFWIFGPSLVGIEQVYFELENNGYPAYLDIESAVKALGAMYQYTKIQTENKNVRGLS